MAFVVKTFGDLAAIFGVSRKTIQEWKAKGCPGFEARGEYDAAQVYQWISTRPTAPTNERADIETDRARLKRELDRIEVAKAMGDLVSLPVVTAALTQHIAEAKVHLQQGPDRLLAKLPAKAPVAFKRRYRDALQEWVDDVCNALAASAEGLAEAIEADDSRGVKI